MIKRKLIIVIPEKDTFTLDNIEALQDLRDEFIEAVESLRETKVDEVHIESTILSKFLHSMVDNLKKEQTEDDAEEARRRRHHPENPWDSHSS